LPKKHSLVFDTGAKIPAESAFLEYQDRSGAVLTPELFPRADGTTYVCAISSEEPLPVDPARVAPGPRRDRAAGGDVQLDVAGPRLGEDPRAAGVLSLGVTRDGLPLIGPVPGVASAYIAAGRARGQEVG
jgi:hypothetical protein